MDKELAHNLSIKSCNVYAAGAHAMPQPEIEKLLTGLQHWQQQDREICKTIHFANYYETMAFVNATAWISHREDHHPELEVGYKQCRIRYSTHSVGGLSENDFICAAKIDCLLG